MSFSSFEDLIVWKKAREYKKEISKLVKSFPIEEKYRLADQLIRSSRSINSQVAEGHGRKTLPDKIRFCIIARGSLSESLNHLIDAYDEQLISNEQLEYSRTKITELEKILNGYINWLGKQGD